MIKMNISIRDLLFEISDKQQQKNNDPIGT